MYLLRYILIFLIIYLILKSFFRYSAGEKPKVQSNQKENKNRGVSKEIGEYVDYEEVDD